MQKSLTQRLFEARLGLVTGARRATERRHGDLRSCGPRRDDRCSCTIVAGMNLDNFLVRPHRRAGRAVRRRGTRGRRSPPRTPTRSPSIWPACRRRCATTTRTPSGSTCSSCAASSPSSTATPSPPSGSARRSRRSPPRLLGKTAIPSVAEQAVAAGDGRRRRVVGRRHPAHARAGAPAAPRAACGSSRRPGGARSTPTSRTSSAKPRSSTYPASRPAPTVERFRAKAAAYLKRARGPRRPAAAAPQQAAHARRPRRRWRRCSSTAGGRAGRHRLGDASRPAGSGCSSAPSSASTAHAATEAFATVPRRHQVHRRPDPVRRP